MRRTVLLLGVLSIGYAHAQNYGHQGRVGINTTTPSATFHVSKKTVAANDKRPQGVIFPHISTAERDAFVGPVEKGTMIYNTTENCIDLYDGTKWSCITTVATAGSGNSSGGTPGGGGSGTGTQGAITGNVVLAGKTHYITSVKDKEYIPFVKPTQPATWETGETIGNDPLIDVQGTITTQGITIQIPITGSGTIGAYRQEVAVTAEKSKNNQAGTLILEWDAQQVTSSNSYITAKLKSKNTDFHIKQLDLAKGLGNDYKGLVLANFTYKKDNTNSATETFTVRAISGILDKKFGVQTNGKYEHDFIYLPIQGPDGRTWLNNNLGAEYARVGSPYFNPTRQAGALDYTNLTTSAAELTNPTADQIKKDWRAYGYLYEFRRDSDGHEVVTWTSHDQGFFPNGGQNHGDPGTIVMPTIGTAGNPCPQGFSVPRTKDWGDLLITQDYGHAPNIIDGTWTIPSSLGLTTPGYRRPDENVIEGPASIGNYWMSHEQNNESTSTLLGITSQYRAWITFGFVNDGASVRCIQD